MSYAVTYMWKLKKGYNDLLCRTYTNSQTSKTLWLPKETDWQGRDGLGDWDGDAVNLGCDYHCTNINIIKFVEFKFKKKCVALIIIIGLIYYSLEGDTFIGWNTKQELKMM